MLKESKVVIIVVMQLIYKYDRQSIFNMADIQRHVHLNLLPVMS